MDYKEAVKKLATKQDKGNFLMINAGYDKYILPYKDGLAFLATLEKAEQYNDPYAKKPTISPIEKNKIQISIMSHEEYTAIKIAALLDITVDEVLAMTDKH